MKDIHPKHLTRHIPSTSGEFQFTGTHSSLPYLTLSNVCWVILTTSCSESKSFLWKTIVQAFEGLESLDRSARNSSPKLLLKITGNEEGCLPFNRNQAAFPLIEERWY
jgi:hypothetical protein